MAEESGGEPRRGGGCGIGARLRDARERTGMTLEQAAQRLHLAAQTLEALEAEQFDALGAPIYVKSYLARYAELLGESPEALQALLGSAAALAQPDLTRIPHAPPAPNRPTLAVGLVLGALVVAALAWWGWSYRHSRLAALVRSASVPAQQPESRPPAPPTAAQSRAPQALRASAPAGVAVGSGLSANTMSGVPAGAAPTAEQAAVQITLSFPAASWVSVRDATGRSLYRGMVGAGALRTLAGPAPLHVVLGFADGVTLTANGRAAPIAPYVGRDHAVSIDVSAAGQVSPVPRRTGG
ncbi:MAG: helix-turn-helix domain-containing protein [Steroidobacteraceae bacterium]